MKNQNKSYFEEGVYALRSASSYIEDASNSMEYLSNYIEDLENCIKDMHFSAKEAAKLLGEYTGDSIENESLRNVYDSICEVVYTAHNVGGVIDE